MPNLDAFRGVINTVLLDIGGVLYVDPWQTVILSPNEPGLGLADQLGLDHQLVAEVAEELWPTFATQPLEEDDYWSQLSRGVSALTNRPVEFPPDLVAETSDRLLRPLPHAWSLLRRTRALLAEADSRRIGVITDNTTFWYRRQYRDLYLSFFVESTDVEFVSAELGFRKPDHPGLYGRAAESCDPATTLIIDDRRKNLDHAASFGFHVLLMEGGHDAG